MFCKLPSAATLSTAQRVLLPLGAILGYMFNNTFYRFLFSFLGVVTGTLTVVLVVGMFTT